MMSGNNFVGVAVYELYPVDFETTNPKSLEKMNHYQPSIVWQFLHSIFGIKLIGAKVLCMFLVITSLPLISKNS